MVVVVNAMVGLSSGGKTGGWWLEPWNLGWVIRYWDGPWEWRRSDGRVLS